MIEAEAEVFRHQTCGTVWGRCSRMVQETTPDLMRAVVIRRHGGPDVLEVEQVPTPTAGPGEILVRVEATALNHLDIFAREGLHGPGVPPIHLPHVSGVDIAGVVVDRCPTVPEERCGPAIGRRVLINS